MSRLDSKTRAAYLLGWVLVYTPPPVGAPLGAGVTAMPDPRKVST